MIHETDRQTDKGYIYRELVMVAIDHTSVHVSVEHWVDNVWEQPLYWADQVHHVLDDGAGGRFSTAAIRPVGGLGGQHGQQECR